MRDLGIFPEFLQSHWRRGDILEDFLADLQTHAWESCLQLQMQWPQCALGVALSGIFLL